MSSADNTYKNNNNIFIIFDFFFYLTRVEFYYVIMFEEAEHFEFAKNTLRADERLKNVGHFFQGDTFTISWICHRPVFQKRKKMYHSVQEELPHSSRFDLW